MKSNSILVAGTVVIIATVVAISWYLSRATATLNPQVPSSQSSVLPPLPKSLSTVTVPIFIPIATVRSFLDKEIPPVFIDSSDSEVVNEIKLRASASWKLARTPLVLSGNDGAMGGAVAVAGPVRVAAHLGPARASTTIDLGGRILMSARPQIQADWRMTVPDFHLKALLDEATVDLSLPITRMVPFELIENIPIIRDLPLIGAIISGVRQVVRTVMKPIKEITTFPVSVRGIVQRYLDPEIASLRDDIVRDVGAADFLRKSAEGNWKKLCINIPVESGLWLQIKPIRARASQPQIHDDGILLQLGIDAETWISPREVEPNCPFPESVTLESPKPSSIEINLPAEIEYSVLNAGISDLLVGKTFGNLVSVRVDDVITVEAAGRSLLLGLAVTVDTHGWFGTQAAGTVYVLAEPHLDVESNKVLFLNVHMDTDSRNALVAAVGEIGEPLLERAIERYELNLASTYQQLLSTANNALGALSSDGLAVNGRIDDVRLIRLDVDEEAIRLLGTARGNMSVIVNEVPDRVTHAPNPHFSVRRGKALSLSGCESHPATVAPAGSSRSGSWRQRYELKHSDVKGSL